MKLIHSSGMLPLLLSSSLLLQPLAAARPGTSTVAIQAGSAYLVEGARTLEGGVTLLAKEGRILAIGPAAEVEIPPGARVFDYGDDATIIPGLVAAQSPASGIPSGRTAAPSVRAADNIDFKSRAFIDYLSGGVTTAYVPPAEARLIAGVGAVCKLAGSGERLVSDGAFLHGSIGRDARNTPPYWEPPIPATVDVGLGVALVQLPRSTLGAIIALHELVDSARAGLESEAYGSSSRDLRDLLESEVPWRMHADTEVEIRALLRFAEESHIDLVIEGARGAGPVAEEIAAAGVPVVLEVELAPQAGPRDHGKSRDDLWPSYDTAARLADAGVRFAIATSDGLLPRDLRFAAALASRGGLEEERALAAITLDAAEVLRLADSLGSLSVGKDADFVILNGPPLEISSSVLATWVGGETAWNSDDKSTALVIEVEELFVGDGSVLRPGQVLVLDGLIAEVGEEVSHPLGAKVVRGPAAMPGMIDSFGHLGLEGSTKSVDLDYKLSRLVEPGDFADRKVARSGVTTVVFGTREIAKDGSPLVAYKPAGVDPETMVLKDPTAIALRWSDERNRTKSGRAVKELLEKARAYDKEWREYEKAIAEWTPPPARPDAEEKGAEAEEEAEDKDSSDEDKKDEQDEDKEKAKEKDEKDEAEGDILPGIWTGNVLFPDPGLEARLRLRLEFSEDSSAQAESKEVIGSLRCAALGEDLVELSGKLEEESLELEGWGSRGKVRLTGTIQKNKLKGTLFFAGDEVPLEIERSDEALKWARRPERRRESEPNHDEPKGKPKEPKRDEKLELFRKAMRSELAVFAEVNREDEILECVEAFEEAGIRPILRGANEAWRVTEELQGRVAGVALRPTVLRENAERGLRGRRNRFAELAQAGIPFVFLSEAEEGASELPLIASYAIASGLSPGTAIQALTSDAAELLHIDDRVGRLAKGLDGDLLLLDGPPLSPSTSVLRAWVNGVECLE